MFALDDMANSGLWKNMVIEMLANLVLPLPFLYNVKYYDLYNGELYKIKTYSNTLLIILSLLIRTYHVVRVFLESSMYMSSRAHRVNLSVGNQVTYSYAFKCIFKENSLKFCGFYTIMSLSIFGYAFRIAELPNSFNHPNETHFELRNSLWVAIVSMTTVGYGDIIPHTGTGTYTGLICSVVGIQLTAFFLISFKNFLQHTDAESFAYELRENTDATEEIRQKALKHIISFYKYRHRGTSKAKEMYRNTHSNT